RSHPELAVADVGEDAADELQIREGQRAFVLGADVGGHPAVDVDDRVVGDRVPGKKLAAGLKRRVHGAQQGGAVVHVVDGVGDVNEGEVAAERVNGFGGADDGADLHAVMCRQARCELG